jgi:hypothetical protein
MKACEGVPVESKGDVLLAGFETTQTAIAAARRMQWAVQGFSEAEGQQNTNVALLVQSSPEGRDANRPALMDKAAPGQILLSERVWRIYESVPGLPLQQAGDAGLRELLWRARDDEATPGADEQVYADLLAMQGLEYRPATDPEMAAERGAIGREPQADTAFGGAADGGLLVWIQQNSRIAIGGLSAVALLIVALSVYHFAGGKSAQPVAKPAGNSVPAPEAGNGNSPATGAASPAAANGPGENSKADRSNHQTAAEAMVQKSQKDSGKRSLVVNAANGDPSQDHVVAPAAVSVPQMPAKQEVHVSRCDMSQSEISGTLDLAERSFQRSKYDAAERQFRTVLSCDPNNARAREGLEKVHTARESEN